jgi:hypothetical protein
VDNDDQFKADEIGRAYLRSVKYTALQPYESVPVEGSGMGGSGHKNELLFSMEGRSILDEVSDFHLLRKNYVPWKEMLI